MTQGQLIVVVFGAVVTFIGGVATMLSFVKTWFVEPQVKATEAQLMQNNAMGELTKELKHQNELTELKLLQIGKDIQEVDGKVDQTYRLLDGRVVKLEAITFKL